jgi:hypothetical protein
VPLRMVAAGVPDFRPSNLLILPGLPLGRLQVCIMPNGHNAKWS